MLEILNLLHRNILFTYCLAKINVREMSIMSATAKINVRKNL